jgi:ABC-type transport system involved in cytochrome c biogenesis permease subunit
MIDQKWQAALFVGALGGLIVSWVASIAGMVWGRPMFRRVFLVALGLSVVCQTALLVAFSVRRGTIAVYNKAEFMFAFAWAASLVMGYFVGRRGPWWIGVTVGPLCFLTLGYVLLVPGTSGEVSLASVRSIWLLLHILTSVVAYASFTVTFGAGVMLLLRHYFGVGKGNDPAAVNRVGYRAAVFGFPFMTMVLFTGALWAKYRNGVYWSWDPIETWALVTWLIYAAYLHAQYTRGWEGVRAAWLSVMGFGCVVSTYLFFTHYWF